MLRPIGTEFVERYHPVNPDAPRIDVRWRVVGHHGLITHMVELLEAVAVLIVPNARPTYQPDMEYKGEE